MLELRKKGHSFASIADHVLCSKTKSNEIKTALDDFRQRVKGQDFALVKTLDVVKRAVTGMAGLQSTSHAKPKGILFFAGPTGTGKTETAKTLAEKLFGDESCCISNIQKSRDFDLLIR